MAHDIKKRSARHIYYGVHKDTGELMHISQVASGQKCNCVCAACGQPFEARKGSIRRHHFAHVSNYECMYASEVAIYKALAAELEKTDCMALPPVMLRFPAWPKDELLQNTKTVHVDSVGFKCEPLAYPPLLTIKAQGSCLRILLDFNHYYDSEDLAALATEAKNNGYSLLKYAMPKLDEDQEFTPDRIMAILKNYEKAEWVFSRLEQHWKEKYYAVAIEPEEHGSGYLCPISIGRFKGKYSARWVDCAYCRFNVAEPPVCLCVAKAGIQKKDDFKRSPEERTAEIDRIRIENEKKIQEREEYTARTVSRIQTYRPSSYPKAPAIPSGPPKEELDAEYDRICQSFDVNSEQRTVDRFNRRWILCEECGEVKQDTQMAIYGGIGRINRGVCSSCSRNGKKD